MTHSGSPPESLDFFEIQWPSPLIMAHHYGAILGYLSTLNQPAYRYLKVFSVSDPSISNE